MAGLKISLKPWRPIRAVYDKAAVLAWLADTGRTAQRIFRVGSLKSRGGRLYIRRGGRAHRASAPGDWPARDTGRLLGTLKARVTLQQVEIGTSATSDRGFPYSLALRTGTRKMARRKMSDDALKEALPITRARRRAFAKFRRG